MLTDENNNNNAPEEGKKASKRKTAKKKAAKKAPAKKTAKKKAAKKAAKKAEVAGGLPSIRLSSRRRGRMGRWDLRRCRAHRGIWRCHRRSPWTARRRARSSSGYPIP